MQLTQITWNTFDADIQRATIAELKAAMEAAGCITTHLVYKAETVQAAKALRDELVEERAESKRLEDVQRQAAVEAEVASGMHTKRLTMLRDALVQLQDATAARVAAFQQEMQGPAWAAVSAMEWKGEALFFDVEMLKGLNAKIGFFDSNLETPRRTLATCQQLVAEAAEQELQRLLTSTGVGRSTSPMANLREHAKYKAQQALYSIDKQLLAQWYNDAVYLSCLGF